MTSTDRTGSTDTADDRDGGAAGAQRVSCTIRDGVADVRLERPDKRNALDPAMFTALARTGERLHADPSVRAVVLSGAGRSFCAGLDVAAFGEMATGEHDLPGTDERADGLHGPATALGQRAAHVWTRLPVPVIAALHGHAYGGGLQIALGADVRLAAPDTRLSVMEIDWGLVPDMTGTQVLPELVGRDVAKELTFTGRIVEAEEAGRLGLVTRVVDEPVAEALRLAADVASRNPDAIREAKRLLDLAGRVGLEEGFAAEQTAIRRLIGSPNQAEAVRAKLDGRAPTFTDPS
ncbi:crotonase/enoyl-CoA hydratase family protein [Prauserella rugosa]|uniref:Enoyl-CoA hydratase/carnithine racemase n=1 Tax=Prauserella rugosa TaxID=43354 RepID=A0A660CBB1_9PSEU|nr:crotonase/enoyl-CoA hydratase family protein [Prauserella rugosa]TWH19614.1 enoyl-CoA hydratase/carnithine racemase [Prauserella rugosa]